MTAKYFQNAIVCGSFMAMVVGFFHQQQFRLRDIFHQVLPDMRSVSIPIAHFDITKFYLAWLTTDLSLAIWALQI